MSTTFDIVPTKNKSITFEDVKKNSENQINNFLTSIGVSKKIFLKMEIHHNQEKYLKKVNFSENFEWLENEYLWISVNDYLGGTDVYCDNIKESNYPTENDWWLLDSLKSKNNSIDNLDEKICNAKRINKLWSFRKSAGQPPIIALSYGLISGTVAKLTDGIIWSDDNAWDYKIFPIQSEDFFNNYFKPENTNDLEFKELAQQCIEDIKKEFR